MTMNPLLERLTRRSLLRAAVAGGSLISLETCRARRVVAGRRSITSGRTYSDRAGDGGRQRWAEHGDPARRRGLSPGQASHRDSRRRYVGGHSSKSDCIPSLRGLADLLEQGRLAIVQGVGYPDPNRSHFESMDIWHTCRLKGESRADGWLGRYLEAAKLGALQDPPALHLGSENQPLALMSREIRVPSIQSLEQFRLRGADRPEMVQAIRELSSVQRDSQNDLLGFVQSSTSSAIATSQRLESIGTSYKPSEGYPSSELGRKFETIARLVASNLKTKIYYLRIDGFDTHSNQPDVQAALLREVSESVSAFLRDANSQGFGDRLLVMCFSEFGRRVAENASDGTDHGTAGPVLLAGNQVRAGLIGEHPSLSDLDQGDLKYHTDFRQVYAALLEQWLAVPSEQVLGGVHDPLSLLKT